jgi:arginyl-tRNA--protein-N-Asp/Glu arginylyltransferase
MATFRELVEFTRPTIVACMRIALSYVSPAVRCGYLPDRLWRLRYEIADELTPAEYEKRMEQGWRRFGHALFTTDCPACRKCQSLRVDVKAFQPNRSQRRAEKANRDLAVTFGPPQLDEDRLKLYDRFHAARAIDVGWKVREPESAASYYESFIDNPFVTQEWCYWLGERLVAVGYVDHLPQSLSAIYFFSDPDLRGRSLGTFNVLSVIRSAREQALPHVYLGYYVEGCRSLEYKANFGPHERLVNGVWMGDKDIVMEA